MSTSARLRAAVASFPVVRSVRARASFPHGLRIEVREQPPVAVLVAAGVRAAVAADGVVLGPEYVSGSLPVLSAGSAAAASLSAVGGHVRDGSLRAALTVLGAAPAPLAQTVEKAYAGPKGLTLVLRGGLLAYFGDATRPHAKWLSLARVLADPSSARRRIRRRARSRSSCGGFPARHRAPHRGRGKRSVKRRRTGHRAGAGGGSERRRGSDRREQPGRPRGLARARHPRRRKALRRLKRARRARSPLQAETPAPSQPGSSAGAEASAGASGSEGTEGG